jgi:hypothetical protein
MALNIRCKQNDTINFGKKLRKPYTVIKIFFKTKNPAKKSQCKIDCHVMLTFCTVRATHYPNTWSWACSNWSNVARSSRAYPVFNIKRGFITAEQWKLHTELTSDECTQTTAISAPTIQLAFYQNEKNSLADAKLTSSAQKKNWWCDFFIISKSRRPTPSECWTHGLNITVLDRISKQEYANCWTNAAFLHFFSEAVKTQVSIFQFYRR